MAKTTVAELVAKFTGDTTGLEKSIGKATAAVGKYGAAAAAVAGTALVALTRASMKAADANGDLADQLGITTESLGAMQLAFSETGSSAEAIAPAFAIMRRNLFAAATGAKAQGQALAALGIEIDALMGMAPDQQFETLAAAIAKIENPTAKAGVAAQIFGRNAQSLMVTINEYGQSIDEARAFNEKFNVSISRLDTEKIAMANDALGRVGKVLQGLGNTIALEVAPVIQYLADAFINSGISGQKFGEWVKGGMVVAAAAIDLVRRALNGLDLAFNAIIVAISAAVKKVATEMYNFSVASAKMWNAILPGNDRTGNNAFLKVANDAGYMEDAAQDAFNSAVKGGQDFETTLQKINKIQADSQTNAEAFMSKRDANAATMGIDFDAFSEGADEAKEDFSDLKKALDDNQRAARELRNRMADTFSGFVSSVGKGEDALQSLKSTALNVLNDVVNSMFRLSFGGESGGGIGGFLAESLFSGLGMGTATTGSGYNPAKGPPPMKPFAKGGVISRATMFPIGGGAGVMGERGPEAIMPLVRGAGGKLGVASQGGGGATVNQTINVSTGVAQTVRAEMARMLPQFQQIAIASVQDAKNRNLLAGA